MARTNFAPGSSAVIIGASRGIGLALVDALASRENFERVVAACRRPDQADRLQQLAEGNQNVIKVIQLDVTVPDSVDHAAGEIAAMNIKPALVIHAAGLLHDDGGVAPEKKIEDINLASLENVFRVNAFGPALVMKAFLPIMTRKERAVLAAISARVGSIGDNRLGGWYAYRASKAALNQLMKTASIESRRRFSNIILASLHPGTTDTGLSRPYQANVPDDKLFSPDFVAERLLSVIDGLGEQDSGEFFAWDGEHIPW